MNYLRIFFSRLHQPTIFGLNANHLQYNMQYVRAKRKATNLPEIRFEKYYDFLRNWLLLSPCWHFEHVWNYLKMCSELPYVLGPSGCCVLLEQSKTGFLLVLTFFRAKEGIFILRSCEVFSFVVERFACVLKPLEFLSFYVK